MKYISIIIFVLISLSSLGQEKQAIIRNDNIEFEMGRRSVKLLSADSVRPSTYLIHVLHADQMKAHLLSLNKKDVLDLLNDERSDWATNLLLYDIYKKDAHLYFGWEILTKEDWVQKLKEKDSRYWTEFILSLPE